MPHQPWAQHRVRRPRYLLRLQRRHAHDLSPNLTPLSHALNQHDPATTYQQTLPHNHHFHHIRGRHLHPPRLGFESLRPVGVRLREYHRARRLSRQDEQARCVYAEWLSCGQLSGGQACEQRARKDREELGFLRGVHGGVHGG